MLFLLGSCIQHKTIFHEEIQCSKNNSYKCPLGIKRIFAKIFPKQCHKGSTWDIYEKKKQTRNYKLALLKCSILFLKSIEYQLFF